MALNALKINWRNEQSEKRPNVLHNSHSMLCYKTGIVLDEIKSFFSISLAFSLCTYCLKVRKIAAAALTELLYKQQKNPTKNPFVLYPFGCCFLRCLFCFYIGSYCVFDLFFSSVWISFFRFCCACWLLFRTFTWNVFGSQ